MSRILKYAAALTIVSAVALGPAVQAAGGGQIEGGNIYRAKNVTKGSDFVDPASADAGDTLLYKVRIHNPGQECLTNVNVKAILPTGANQTNVSTVTVWADNATTNFISDTATVDLSSAQKIDFVPGSVKLLDANGNAMNNLPDSAVNGAGVNIGQICVSVNNKRFVQFQAKVEKPSTPATTPPPVKEIPNTGAGAVAGLFAGASALGMAGHYAVRRRRA